MQRRKLTIPMVALATMALMFSATGASAVPHETVGEVVAECLVDGSVTLEDPHTAGTGDPGLDEQPSNNKYTFEDTTLECDAVPVTGAKGGTYNVTATGTTADFRHQAGEDCDQGGSVTETQTDGTSDVHSGNLSADGVAPAGDMAGEVHFVRLGTTVLADGPLYKGTLTVPDPKPEPDWWFQAELEFIPNPVADCVNNAVETADLTGTAELYDAVAHDCGVDSSKDTKDHHCDTL